MKYEHYTPEAVILANGEYPSHPLPLQMLENAEFVVCCDGAANEYASSAENVRVEVVQILFPSIVQLKVVSESVFS